MTKTKGVLILSTAIFSGISAILCFVSLGTQQWVVSKATIENYPASDVNYGLFSGLLTRYTDARPKNFELTMTCVDVGSESICALSCSNTAEKREKEVRDIYNGLSFTFPCTEKRTGRFWDIPERLDYRRYDRILPKEDRIFINYGMYMSTLVFLCFSAAFSLISAGFSVLNTATNPVEPWFNVFGLYFYNGAACVFLIITLAIWVAEFGERITKNVAIFDTLTGVSDSRDLASLGFSYWILLLSLILHISNDVILLVRQYLINQEPEVKEVNMDDKQDGQIMLY